MKNLLYFEECETKLSHALLNRTDINLIIIRTTKNMKFFSKEYLEKTKNCNCYIIDYYNELPQEVEKFKKWLKNKNIKLDYFLNDSEYYLEFSNNFARQIGLNALSEKQVKLVRDKVIMKQEFIINGIKTTNFRAIQNKKELIDYWIENERCPIVIKPRSEMNSKGVYKIESFDDIDKIPYEIVPNKYMAEIFCYGHEWSIESLVQNGKVLDSYLSYLPNASIWASIENKLHAHISCINQPDYFEMKPKDYIQKIVDAFGLLNGAMTIEIFVMENGKMIAGELGWRLPGGMACENHSMSYGFDIWNALIDIAVGKIPNLKYYKNKKYIGNIKLANLEGIVQYVTPIEELLNYAGVIDGQVFAKIGQYQTKRRVGSDSSGWIQVEGTSINDILQKMQIIHNNYKIIIDNDSNKVRRLKR